MYPVELLDIKEIETEFGDSWRWIFDVLGAEEETLVSGITSQRMSEKSKAYKWTSGLLGRKPEVGEEIDLDDLMGLRGLAELKTATLRDGTEVSNVADVNPTPKKKKSKGKARKEEEEDEEEEEERPKKKKSKRKPREEEEEDEEEEEERPRKKKSKGKPRKEKEEPEELDEDFDEEEEEEDF